MRHFFSSDTEYQSHHFYRALDFLEEHHDELEEDLYFTLCNLFNRKVDLIFFDTTSTYFEIRDPDEDDIRQYGHPHCHRSDRPQILIGVAVNNEGLPLASEVFPGNTADVTTVKKMIKRTRQMGLERCIFVSDRGTVSEDNLRALEKENLDYIVGVKFRTIKELKEVELPNIYEMEEIADNLRVKEVLVNGNRYVVCYNPKEARKDRITRDKWIAKIEKLLPSINKGEKKESDITNHIVMKRLVKKIENNKLKLDEDKIKEEESYDGLYIVRTSIKNLPSKEVVLSYKMLQRVEQAFHYIKSFVEIRPCYHWTEYRIKGHVLLCMLAYLFQRWIELKTDYIWPVIRSAFKKIHAVELVVNKQKFIQRSKLSKEASEIFRKLKIKYPNKIIQSPP